MELVAIVDSDVREHEAEDDNLELGDYSCQIWDHYFSLGGENRKCISESFLKKIRWKESGT